MSEYFYSEDKVLDVTIEPKEFVSLKNIKLIYEFRKDFIPSFGLDKELKDELLGLSAKLYLETTKRNQIITLQIVIQINIGRKSSLVI